ncbi:MAG: hypothetical protein GTO55_06745 [Armatimonadetes bacterium]|nr:hypothetical protein [Armatimonadota bacterium]NIN06060.1 hypothetical protein [Armatimonadota bacterium]NIT31382.1 hypothetical protein [Armatimonadota bacterium]
MADKPKKNDDRGNSQEDVPLKPGEKTSVTAKVDDAQFQEIIDHLPPKSGRNRHNILTLVVSVFVLIVFGLQWQTLRQTTEMSRNDQRAQVGEIEPVGKIGPGAPLINTGEETPGIVKVDHAQFQEIIDHLQPKSGWDRHKTLTLLVSIFVLIVLVLQWRTLCQTIRMSRTDQRAWVGQTDPDGKIDPRAPLNCTITIKNFGRTPALNVKQEVHLRFQPANNPFVPDAPEAKQPGSNCVLQPDQEVKAYVTYRKPTEEEVDNIKSGKITVYFFGEIAYEDIFEKQHLTTFAYYANPSMKGWSALHTYNYAD